MNLYDFDETIYNSDSTRDFCIYLYLHHPRTLLYLPKQLAALAGYMSGKLDKTEFKERYFSMFKAVPDIHDEVEKFWDKHDYNLCRYYPGQARHDDVVISASPYFIVAPLCYRLGITHIIASNVNPETGEFIGENCYGEEKVRRFLAAGYDPEEVECVYSDSLSDTPMADLGKKYFIVTKKGLTGWVPPKQKGMQGFFTLFNKPEALVALLLGAANVLVSGHAAKIIVRDKAWPAVPTQCAIMAFNSACMVGGFHLLGKKSDKCNLISRAVAKLSVPLLLATGLVSYGVLAVTGAPVLAIAVATVLGLPVVYKGVQLLFRKEIAKQQMLAHIKKEEEESK